jgi:hypothetical protein
MDVATKKLPGRYCAANLTRGPLLGSRRPSGGAMMTPIGPSGRWSGFCRSARASTRPCPWRWFRHGLGGTWSALDRHRCVSVVQHGWAHANHAGAAGEKGACEVGLHRGRKAILGDLRKGRDVLEDAFAGYFQPVVTPPWNRIDPALFPDLALMGYRGISTFGARNDEPVAAGLVAQNCHCDPIDWKAGTVFRGTRRSLVQLTGHLADRREGRVDSDEATGSLTHHRDMVEKTWAFAERLIETIVRHPAARWADARELFLP